MASYSIGHRRKEDNQWRDSHGAHQGQLAVCFLSLELEIALSISSDLRFIFNNTLVKTVHQTEDKDDKLHFLFLNPSLDTKLYEG